MQSLLKSLGVEQRDEYRLEYPAEGGFRRVLVSQSVVGNPLSDADMQRLVRFMTPPTEAQCEGWLAELSVIAPARQVGELSGALQVQAYINRLRGYPADIVRATLLDREWRFFPSWFELKEVLEAEDKSRRQLLALAEAVEPEKPAKVIKLPVYDEPSTERGPLPFVPEPSAPVPNVAHLKEELRELECDKELAASEHGKAYAQSLIQRIAEIEGPKSVITNTTREAG